MESLQKWNCEMDKVKNVLILVVGWSFVFFGIVGLFLPVLQGILFIMIGLAILSSRSELVKRFLSYLEHRFPHYHEKVEYWRKKVRNWKKRD